MPMLTRLRIKNFKLLRDVEIEFERDKPTVFIGTNASGKSTVLEVLAFLSRCADESLEKAIVAHGGGNTIRTFGALGPIEIQTTWVGITKPSPLTLTWSLVLEVSSRGKTTIRSEILTVGERRLVDTVPDGSRHVFDETAPEHAPGSTDKPDVLAFHAFADPVRYSKLAAVKLLASFGRVSGTLSAPPAWARHVAERASPRDSMVISTDSLVGSEGIGLANALYNLQIEHRENWEQLERAFRAEFPFVQRVLFPPDPGGSRISFAIEDTRFPGRRVLASEMSDGMIVYLCLLALMAHPTQIGFLGLDEPDAHLHPSAVRRLLAFAAKHSSPKRPIVMVTHSNAILDELVDPAASIRVVEATQEGARIRKLDPEALAAWRKDYSLSDLRRTGLLDPANSDYGSGE